MMSEAKLQGKMKAGGGSGEEPMTTQELLQRLQELETENSALAQANENQRETYERCLDEVANHVVQALLNQKDLREECIKLKKRVFDLERQNQVLSDLLHQRLTSGPLSQFPVHPASLLLDPFSNSQTGAVEKLPTTFPLGRCITQREVLSEETCVGIPGPNPQALEALSPFLRKKAQILEVLRSLEEMDPLLAFPSPWRDPGQAATTEGVTAEAWPCLLLAQGESVASPPPLKREGSSSSSSDEAGEPEPPEKGHPGQVLLSALAERKIDLGDVETYLQQVLREAGDPALLNGEPNGPCVLEGSEGPVGGYKHIQAVSCLEGLGPPSASCEPVYLGVLAPGEVKDRPHQGPPIPSPSKVLKLLKMPPPPPSPAALRLSPQLTRSSKIPCRSNTYEVYHSLTPNHKGSPDSPFPHEASIVGGHSSPKASRHLTPGPTKVTPTSPEPFGYRRPHDYENILELSLSGAMDSHPRDGKQGGPEGLSPACRSAPLLAVPASHACLEPYPFVAGSEKPGPESRHSPPLARRNPEGSKKVLNGPSKRTNMPEVANMSFKERLTVLGKLKGTEGKESAGFEKGKGPARPCERVEGLVETHPRLVTGSSSLKHHEPCHSAEPSPRGYASHSVGSRGSDAEHHVSRNRPLGTPATRHPAKVPPPGKNAKSPHGSPTKLPSKSPTKAPAQEPKPCSPPTKASQNSMGRKNPPCSDPARGKAGGPATIEEKVMKGIEENVLRRHKGAPAAGEVKQKNSSGLANWFGLRKSKLPALNRRPEAPKTKEGKVGSRRLEAESLNISKLMEKAEDLRKALEEEKAYINGLALDKPRPHGCNPGHSQLTLMYQEVTAENFMQQLLNRVDGKEVPFETHLEQKNELQRGLRDAKDPHLVRPPRNGIIGHLHACPEAPAKLRDTALQEQVPPEDNLAEAVSSQHFAACGSLTRTLDSGIGTFPPPDYCSGMPCKSVPKLRPRLEPPPAGFSPARGPPPVTRMPRKARTLEREVPSAEDLLGTSKHQSMPAFHGVLTSAEPALGHHDHRGCPEDLCSEPSKPRHTQQSKNWTFPNAKVSISTDPFFCSPHRLEGLHGSAMGSACSVVERRRTSSEGPQASPAFSTSSSRTPSASDMGEEVSTEARSRDMGPEGQPGLENSESLSDSLYDSLSSCGSQG